MEAIHVAYPTTGPSAGPYPLVVFAHGFELPVTEYVEYLQHWATFGYVALTADYPYSAFAPDQATAAQDLSGALDWAVAQNTQSGTALLGLIDTSHAAVSGHSLGGKLALLAAAADARFGVVFTLDPVDDAMGCSPPACPSAASMLPLPQPIAFLGETIDGQAGAFGQACAPAADNFQVLYAASGSPSLEVNVLGANHMSFLDDPSCGLVCDFCNAATADPATVHALAEAYAVAFLERYLRGTAAYDAYLTGTVAQSRYVPNAAQIDSK